MESLGPPVGPAPRRLAAAFQVVARRRAYLLAVAAVSAALALLAVVLLVIVLAVARVLPPRWPALSWGLGVAVLVYAALAAPAFALVEASVRAMTLLGTAPRRSDPVGLVGGFLGLGLFMLGRRLRARRGPLGWLADPFGAAAGLAASRALPPEHPLAALLEVGDLGPAKPPSRGAGLVVGGLVAAAVFAVIFVDVFAPVLAVPVFAVAVLVLPVAGTWGAALRGTLLGAWDRTVLDRAGEQASGAADALGRAFRRLGGPGLPGG